MTGVLTRSTPESFLALVHDVLWRGDLDAQPPVGALVEWRSDSSGPQVPDLVPFSTSGTTGTPVTWWLRREQLWAEAAVLAGQFEGTAIDGVICHAAPRHLFGYLASVMVPFLLGVPSVVASILDPVPLDLFRHPLVVTVPSSWVALNASPELLPDGASVLHGTGPISDPSVAESLATRGRFVEVLGSTETGAIAFRRGPRTTWTRADDVSIVDPLVGQIGALRVRSPRLASPAPEGSRVCEHVDGDIVCRLDADRFELLGRSLAVVKINGRRVDLQGVLTRVRTAAASVAAVPVRDAVRGEWYDLVVGPVPSGRSPSDLGERVAAAAVADVKRACRERLRVWERPRKIVVARQGEDIA